LRKAVSLSWLAVVIPIGVLFGPALFSEESFAFRDAGHFYYPLFQWCCREWGAGRIPLWNPYENCGMPVLADVTSSVFYPGKLLFLLPLEFAFRFKLYIIAHVVLAALGSYWLARTWKAGQPAAAMAAIAYSCGGNVVFQYSNVVFLVGAAWLPFTVLAGDRMLRDRSWIAAIILGLVLALMILGGDPQAAYHALLIIALYAVVLTFWRNDESPTDITAPPRLLTTLVVRVGLFCLAAGSVYCLAAVQCLPSAEALRSSDRAAFNRPRNIYEATTVLFQAGDQLPLGETRQQSAVRGLFGQPEERTHHELAYDFSIGPWRLIEYFWPNIDGRMFPTHHRWLSLLPAEGRVWTPTLYMGLLPAVLALSAFRLRSGSAREVWQSIIVLLFTLGTFGSYGVGWLMSEIWPGVAGGNPDHLTIGSPVGGVYWLMLTVLPKFVYFRYPAKLLPLVALGISQLAAFGLDQTIVQPKPRLQRTILVLGVGSAVMAGLIWFAGSRACANFAETLFAWCIGPTSFANVDWSDPAYGPFEPVGAYHDVLFALVHTALVAIIAWWSLNTMATDRRTLGLLLVLLTAGELALANSWLVVTAPLEIWRNEPPIAEVIRSHQSNATSDVDLPPRVFRASLASWRPSTFSTTPSSTRPAEIVQWEHDTLFPKYPLAHGLALIESYGSIKSADYEALLSIAKQHGPQQQDKSLLPQPAALRLLGTEFLVLPKTHRPDFADRIADARLSDSRLELPRSTASRRPEGAALWRMTRTLPRLWIVHDVEIAAELRSPRRKEMIERRTYEMLFPNGRPRDFSKSAIVETNEPSLELNQLPIEGQKSSTGPERCRITHDSPHRIIAEAELAQPGLLVLRDAWHAGWKAVLTSADGQKEVPIYRTDRVFRGVWLPAGTHTVEYAFESQSFQCGALISGFSWPILALGLLSGLLIRRRRNISGDSQQRL